jgi:glucose-6-phosphate isomerase
MNSIQLWQRYQQYLCPVPELDLTVDISRMGFSDDFFERMEPAMQAAFEAMAELEKGAIANPDENRMVGHYWLRAPDLAPTSKESGEIRSTLEAVRKLAADIHGGKVRPPTAPAFRRLLLVGIGGSALGPMLVADALGGQGDKVAVEFIDNTDPDGIARVLDRIEGKLGETLCVVTSKSGGTPETRNGMLVVAEAYRKARLEFPKHAVAITMPGSKMDELAVLEDWLARIPMSDWVGGRTSVTSAVGLLPAALQGIDIDGLLAGAAACDAATRVRETRRNPAALLALMWHHATGGRGAKDMVVLPYKDRLLLLGRYLQQLIMESLGKRLNLEGERVDQGLTVYGNKGSTDQHAYVQQLRDGVSNFFVLFVRVLESGGSAFEVDPQVTSGDYLHGFLLGTRSALFENNRESMTITMRRVDPFTVGALIALFERAVGLYASLVGINAYHQPGVEAGKKAAAAVLDLHRRILGALEERPETAEALARRLGVMEQVETVHLLLEHLAANGRALMERDPEPSGLARFARDPGLPEK